MKIIINIFKIYNILRFVDIMLKFIFLQKNKESFIKI